MQIFEYLSQLSDTNDTEIDIDLENDYESDIYEDLVQNLEEENVQNRNDEDYQDRYNESRSWSATDITGFDDADLSTSTDDRTIPRARPDITNQETFWTDQLLFMLKSLRNQLDLFLNYSKVSSTQMHSYFLNFFPELCFTKLARETNCYANQNNPPTDWKPATSEDIKLFIFINMMFGIHDLPSYKHFWSND